LSLAATFVGTGGTLPATQSAVKSAGILAKTGGSVSETVIFCEIEAEFPQSSVAVHVRIISYESGQVPGNVVSEKVIVGVASQLSEAVGVAAAGICEHSTVASAGMPAKTGARPSPTEICWLAEVELPQLSVAVQVRMTEKAFAQPPAMVVSTKVSSTFWSQLSVAVTFVGTGGTAPATQSAVKSAGILAKTGGSVS
jgi:hypothetical protein